MSFQDNRDTVIANLIQQFCGLLVFLVVPHLLAVNQYAQVIYATTLLSFIGIADFGMSFVYSRVMPGVYARKLHAEITAWNGNTIRFRFFCAIIFSTVISGVYYLKYHDIPNALLLLLTAPVTVLSTFGIATYVAQGDFSTSRNINIMQSLARLLAIPAVKFLGLTGWFISQIAAIVFALANSGFYQRMLQSWREHPRLDYRIMVKYLPEAITLGLIATVWLQLVSSAKLLAVFSYPDHVIAKYGLASTAYQMVSTMVIAAFTPQTVKTYRMLDEDAEKAMTYVFKSILYAFPVICLLSVSLVMLAPYFFAEFFPQYGVDSALLTPIVLSLMSYPAIVVLGSALIGSMRSYIYLLLVVCWFVAAGGIFKLLQPTLAFYAAAETQFVVIPLYAISLILVVYFNFRQFIRKSWMVWFAILSNLVAPIGYYGWKLYG